MEEITWTERERFGEGGGTERKRRGRDREREREGKREGGMERERGGGERGGSRGREGERSNPSESPSLNATLLPDLCSSQWEVALTASSTHRCVVRIPLGTQLCAFRLL